METTTTTTCCDNQDLTINESFNYACEFINGKLVINQNNYCSDGYEYLTCDSCGKDWDINEFEVEN